MLDSEFRLTAENGSVSMAVLDLRHYPQVKPEFSCVGFPPGVLGTQVRETARGGSHQGSNDYPSTHLRLRSPVSDWMGTTLIKLLYKRVVKFLGHNSSLFVGTRHPNPVSGF